MNKLFSFTSIFLFFLFSLVFLSACNKYSVKNYSKNITGMWDSDLSNVSYISDNDSIVNLIDEDSIKFEFIKEDNYVMFYKFVNDEWATDGFLQYKITNSTLELYNDTTSFLFEIQALDKSTLELEQKGNGKIPYKNIQGDSLGILLKRTYYFSR